MERAEKRTAKAKAAKELSKDDLARIDEMLNNGLANVRLRRLWGLVRRLFHA